MRGRARDEGEGRAAFLKRARHVEGLAPDDIDVEQGAGKLLPGHPPRLGHGFDHDQLDAVAKLLGHGAFDVHRDERVVFDDEYADISH